jgi:hypothetical protein
LNDDDISSKLVGTKYYLNHFSFKIKDCELFPIVAKEPSVPRYFIGFRGGEFLVIIIARLERDTSEVVRHLLPLYIFTIKTILYTSYKQGIKLHGV